MYPTAQNSTYDVHMTAETSKQVSLEESWNAGMGEYKSIMIRNTKYCIENIILLTLSKFVLTF